MIFKILTDTTVLGFYFPQFTGEAQILVTFQASGKNREIKHERYWYKCHTVEFFYTTQQEKL